MMPRRLFPLGTLCLALALTACRSEPQGGAGKSSGEARRAIAAAAPSSGAAPGPSESRNGLPGEFRHAITAVAKQVIPSVVSITTERTVRGGQSPFGDGDPFEFFFGPPGGREPQQRKESGLGSGLVASGEGHILTNNHVVEGAQKIKVQFSGQAAYDAELVGTDKATDLAVIKLKEKPPGGLTPLPFGDSDKLQIGEWVVAVGAPFGLYETVTTGIISAMGRQNTGITTYGNFLQTDAAINPGNSGGPLVNLDGAVVGINTAIYSQSGGYQGIGFAIPVNLARTVMDNLIKHGKVTRGWLGVSIQSLTPEMAEALGLEDPKGALIGDVVPGGPAEKAGLKRGDVVLSLEGREVADANDLMNRVALIAPGTTAEVGVLRDGKRRNVKVKVAKRDEERLGMGGGGGGGGEGGADFAGLGLGVADLSEKARARFRIPRQIKEGAVVVEVAPDGSAAEAGLRPGDVILEANRKRVASASDLEGILGKAPRGKSALLLVNRQGTTHYVAVRPK